MEELIGILEDIMIAIQTAQKSVDHGDVTNAIYNIDHAEIDVQRARNLALSIQRGDGHDEIP